jgi:type II secretory pathway component PulF
MFAKSNTVKRSEFFVQLVHLLQKNAAWDEVFALLAKGQRDAEQRQLPELSQALAQGRQSIRENLQQTGRFSRWELRLIDLGLATGTLSESCQLLARFHLLREQAAARCIAAMKRPLIVTVLVLLAVLFIAAWHGAAWPVLLQRLLLTLLAVVAICGLASLTLQRVSAVDRGLISRFKAVRNFQYLQQSYFFFQGLSQCIDAGFKLPRSLHLNTNMLPDKAMAKPYQQLTKTVAEGGRFSTALLASGLLQQVALPPLPVGQRSAVQAQQHVASAVAEGFANQLFEWAEFIPQVIYALIPLWVLLLLYGL